MGELPVESFEDVNHSGNSTLRIPVQSRIDVCARLRLIAIEFDVRGFWYRPVTENFSNRSQSFFFIFPSGTPETPDSLRSFAFLMWLKKWNSDNCYAYLNREKIVNIFFIKILLYLFIALVKYNFQITNCTHKTITNAYHNKKGRPKVSSRLCFFLIKLQSIRKS